MSDARVRQRMQSIVEQGRERFAGTWLEWATNSVDKVYTKCTDEIRYDPIEADR